MACAEWGRVKLNSEAAEKGNDEPDRVSELIGSDMTSLHIRRHVEHQWQSHTCQREQPHTLNQLSQPLDISKHYQYDIYLSLLPKYHHNVFSIQHHLTKRSATLFYHCTTAILIFRCELSNLNEINVEKYSGKVAEPKAYVHTSFGGLEL